MNSKIASLIILSILFVPIGALAEDNTSGTNTTGDNTTGSNATNKQGLFCQNVDKWTSTIETRLADREAKVVAKVKERDTNVANRRAERDANLENKRDGWDTNRAERYANLEAKATTEEQKQAVMDFEDTIDTAVAVRRAAIDGAITTFRGEVNKLVAARRQAVSAAVNTFKSAVAAAGTKAKEDCSNSVAAATVRQNYRAALKAARDKFQADKQAIDKIGTQMQALAQTRNAAVKQAVDSFVSTLQAAIAQLKLVFNNNE